MNLEKFRICHSTLIEHYQFIEAHLEGIYAAISGKTILDGLSDVEKDNINRLLKEINKIEKDKEITVFSEDETQRILRINKRRNFWCHNCYYDLTFDARTGGPKRIEDVHTMTKDLFEAEVLREELYQKKMCLFDENKSSLLPFLR